jgi:hypothetical protein
VVTRCGPPAHKPSLSTSGTPNSFFERAGGRHAVYHATGKRVRELPITPEKLL